MHVFVFKFFLQLSFLIAESIIIAFLYSEMYDYEWDIVCYGLIGFIN